jgi:hypothetical protein
LVTEEVDIWKKGRVEKCAQKHCLFVQFFAQSHRVAYAHRRRHTIIDQFLKICRDCVAIIAIRSVHACSIDTGARFTTRNGNLSRNGPLEHSKVAALVHLRHFPSHAVSTFTLLQVSKKPAWDKIVYAFHGRDQLSFSPQQWVFLN